MTTPAPDHATHDPELVAAHLDGRLDPADLARVDGWLAACGACAVLHEDLQDLVLATRALPDAGPTRGTSRCRPRTPDGPGPVAGAVSWRPSGRRVTRSAGHWPSGSPRWVSPASSWRASRPLSFGSAAGARHRPRRWSWPCPRAAPAFLPDSVRPAAGGENPVDTTGEGAVDPSAGAGDMSTKSADPDARWSRGTSCIRSPWRIDDAPGGPSWLVIGSLVMLVVGLTLALFRWRARRLGDG